jgi:Ca2+-transporting ATPase
VNSKRLFSIRLCGVKSVRSHFSLGFAYHLLTSSFYSQPAQVSFCLDSARPIYKGHLLICFLSARRLDRKLNIFANWKNWYFWTIFAIMCGGQALIVNVGGAAFQVTRIGGRDWAISIVVGLISLPVGVFVRMLPTAPFERLAIRMKVYPDPNALPEVSPERDEQQWNEGIAKVCFHLAPVAHSLFLTCTRQVMDNLSTFSKIKGGRMRSSSMVLKSRSAQLKEHDIHPSSLLAMVPSLVASSVGAGWRPQQGSLADPAAADPSRSTAALWSGAVQVHPDTPPDDPLVQRFGLPPPSPVPQFDRSRSPVSTAPSSPVSRGGNHSRSPSTSSMRPSIVEPIHEEEGQPQRARSSTLHLPSPGR